MGEAFREKVDKQMDELSQKQKEYDAHFPKDSPTGIELKDELDNLKNGVFKVLVNEKNSFDRYLSWIKMKKETKYIDSQLDVIDSNPTLSELKEQMEKELNFAIQKTVSLPNGIHKHAWTLTRHSLKKEVDRIN